MRVVESVYEEGGVGGGGGLDSPGKPGGRWRKAEVFPEVHRILGIRLLALRLLSHNFAFACFPLDVKNNDKIEVAPGHAPDCPASQTCGARPGAAPAFRRRLDVPSVTAPRAFVRVASTRLPAFI